MKRKIKLQPKKAVDEVPLCSVVINCWKNPVNGGMEVEMVYSGDQILAAYLVHQAQSFLEQEGAEEENRLSSGEIIPLIHIPS